MIRILLLAAVLAVPSSKADAQRWTSTFFGCDPGRSCHRIIFEMEPDPGGLDWIIGTASWQSWFFDPGVAFRFVPYPQSWGGWDLWNLYVQFVWYDEYTTPYWATGVGSGKSDPSVPEILTT